MRRLARILAPRLGGQLRGHSTGGLRRPMRAEVVLLATTENGPDDVVAAVSCAEKRPHG
jgi:hypothetical protein